MLAQAAAPIAKTEEDTGKGKAVCEQSVIVASLTREPLAN